MAATPERLTAIDAALTAGRLTEHSAKVIREWLTLPQFSAFADDLGQRIDQQLWQELDDAYWTVIPFGTGGRRGGSPGGPTAGGGGASQTRGPAPPSPGASAGPRRTRRGRR